MARPWHVDVSLFVHPDVLSTSGRPGLADVAWIASSNGHHHRYADYLTLDVVLELLIHFVAGFANVLIVLRPRIWAYKQEALRISLQIILILASPSSVKLMRTEFN